MQWQLVLTEMHKCVWKEVEVVRKFSKWVVWQSGASLFPSLHSDYCSIHPNTNKVSNISFFFFFFYSVTDSFETNLCWRVIINHLTDRMTQLCLRVPKYSWQTQTTRVIHEHTLTIACAHISHKFNLALSMNYWDRVYMSCSFPKILNSWSKAGYIVIVCYKSQSCPHRA